MPTFESGRSIVPRSQFMTQSYAGWLITSLNIQMVFWLSLFPRSFMSFLTTLKALDMVSFDIGFTLIPPRSLLCEHNSGCNGAIRSSSNCRNFFRPLRFFLSRCIVLPSKFVQRWNWPFTHKYRALFFLLPETPIPQFLPKELAFNPQASFQLLLNFCKAS